MFRDSHEIRYVTTGESFVWVLCYSVQNLLASYFYSALTAIPCGFIADDLLHWSVSAILAIDPVHTLAALEIVSTCVIAECATIVQVRFAITAPSLLKRDDLGLLVGSLFEFSG